MSRSNRRMSRAAAAVAAGLIAASCSELMKRDLETAGLRPADVQRLHPIGAELKRMSHDVIGASKTFDTQSEAYFETTTFVRRYVRDGRGPLYVAAPRGRYNADFGFVRSIARANAVPPERLKIVDRRDGAGHITLYYDLIAPTAPDACENWHEDAGRRAEMGPHANFGCAAQRNLANMVGDPTDLVVPAREAPRGSDRRPHTYKTYVEGEATQVLKNGK